MTEIDEILPDKLYLSGQHGATDYQKLKKAKIYSIVNCSKTVDNLFEFSFVYLKIDVQDHPNQRITQHFKRVFKFINKSRGRVLVHCQGGISRSSTFVIGYLMEFEKMNLRDALTHAHKCREYVHPNEGFMRQLIEYEKGLIEKDVLPKETKPFSMDEYKLFSIRKYFAGKKNDRAKDKSDEELLEILKRYKGDVTNSCAALMYMKKK